MRIWKDVNYAFWDIAIKQKLVNEALSMEPMQATAQLVGRVAFLAELWFSLISD